MLQNDPKIRPSLGQIIYRTKCDRDKQIYFSGERRNPMKSQNVKKRGPIPVNTLPSSRMGNCGSRSKISNWIQSTYKLDLITIKSG